MTLPPGWAEQKGREILWLALVLVVFAGSWLLSQFFQVEQPTHPAATATIVPTFASTLPPPVAAKDSPPGGQAAPAATPTPNPTVTAFPDSYLRFGIDFSDNNQTIQIAFQSTHNPEFNGGQPVRIAFRPGWPCDWANHRGCTSLHRRGQVVLTTTHSGILGEGEPLRAALEGTWLNAAALSMQQVRDNLAALQDSDVNLTQGEAAGGARVIAAVRIPAGQVEDYFSLPVDDALDLAAQYSAEAAAALAGGRPLVVIETCGWAHPEEVIPPGTPSTSASVYLVFVGE